MKKAFFFAASFCLFLAGIHSTAWAAEDNVFTVKINVPRSNTPMATLNFVAVTDKYGRLQELATKFNGDVYHITYQQLRSKDPVAISYSGTQMLTVQGDNTNQQGEGTVRLKIEPMFVGGGVNPVMDLQLVQMEDDNVKKFMTLVKGKAAAGAILTLDKDPAQESMLSLMTAPPQVVKSNVTYNPCTTESIAAGTKTYGSDFAKRSGCQK